MKFQFNLFWQILPSIKLVVCSRLFTNVHVTPTFFLLNIWCSYSQGNFPSFFSCNLCVHWKQIQDKCNNRKIKFSFFTFYTFPNQICLENCNENELGYFPAPLGSNLVIFLSKQPELQISDFQYFNWLGGHRPSFHVPAMLNMIKERVSKLNQFCSSEEKPFRTD